MREAEEDGGGGEGGIHAGVLPANYPSDTATAATLKSRPLIPLSGGGSRPARGRWVEVGVGLHFFTPVFDERQAGEGGERKNKRPCQRAARTRANSLTQ